MSKNLKFPQRRIVECVMLAILNIYTSLGYVVSQESRCNSYHSEVKFLAMEVALCKYISGMMHKIPEGFSCLSFHEFF